MLEEGNGQHGEAMSIERLLTVAELAAVLRMSESWVRKGILEGTLPFTKLGRSVRFTQAQVEAIVARGERPPTTATRALRRHRGAARTRL